MMKGNIYPNGRTPLYIIHGSLTSIRYRDEIMHPLIQPALQGMEPGANLHDDNATSRKAQVVTDFLYPQG